MDLVRYSTISESALTDAGDQIVDVGRKLAPYIRSDKKAAELITYIIDGKSTQGRLFGKNKDVVVIGKAGNKSAKWSYVEMVCLKMVLIFIIRYGLSLRYDPESSPISTSNTNVIHRVYHAMILKEQLDILYCIEFRERKPKAIKDKLALCARLEENEPNNILCEIRNILVHKLRINKFTKQPSSGLLN